MGRRRVSKYDERSWVLYVVSCREATREALREQLPVLYAYLGSECGQQFRNLDHCTIGELVEWSDAQSRANERAQKG